MVAKEQTPLARLGDSRCLLKNFSDRLAVLELKPHEHPGHQWKMECHVKLVAITEVCLQIGRPLVGFGKQHSAGKVFIQATAQLFDDGMRLKEVFAIGTFALNQVGHSIQTK